MEKNKQIKKIGIYVVNGLGYNVIGVGDTVYLVGPIPPQLGKATITKG